MGYGVGMEPSRGTRWRGERNGWVPRDVATITASPQPGFAFSHWEGDASGSANPLSYLPTGPAPTYEEGFASDPGYETFIGTWGVASGKYVQSETGWARHKAISPFSITDGLVSVTATATTQTAVPVIIRTPF